MTLKVNAAVRVTDPEHGGSTDDVLLSIAILLHGSRTQMPCLACSLGDEDGDAKYGR